MTRVKCDKPRCPSSPRWFVGVNIAADHYRGNVACDWHLAVICHELCGELMARGSDLHLEIGPLVDRARAPSGVSGLSVFSS